MRELDRLAQMPTAAAEHGVIRSYLEWMADLPWSRGSIRGSAERGGVRVEILDEDHYGLDKVKDRIVEYIAVLSLKRDLKGPILCFVGPPGTGKTSLGRSIARALGRELLTASRLGGSARRGRDPRSPSDVRRCSPRPGDPGATENRHAKSRDDARRDRQGRIRFSRGSVFGAVGSAGPRAECRFRGSLSRGFLRSFPGALRRDGKHDESSPRGASRSHGGDRTSRVHAGGKDRNCDPFSRAPPDRAKRNLGHWIRDRRGRSSGGLRTLHARSRSPESRTAARRLVSKGCEAGG